MLPNRKPSDKNDSAPNERTKSDPTPGATTRPTRQSLTVQTLEKHSTDL